MTDATNVIIAETASCMWPWTILKIRIKVIAETASRMWPLAYSEDQDQGYTETASCMWPLPILKIRIKVVTISTADVYKWWQINRTLLLLSNMKSDMDFGLTYLDVTLAYSECQLDCRNGVSPNFVAFLIYCSNGVERCYRIRQYMHACVRPSQMYSYVLQADGWT